MYTLLRIIYSPFKWSWMLLNFIRQLILNLFLVIIVLIIIGIYLQINNSVSTVRTGALIIDLKGTVVDKPAVNNKLQQISQQILGTSSDTSLQENSLFDVTNIIRQAKKDKNITGLILSLKDFSGAEITSLEYIGKALQEFRNSGKPIYAFGDSYSQSQYFLASFATKIYLTPQGAVDLHGIAINNFYYKSFLDKLKVNSHVFRVGAYKSAVEPFIRNNMSSIARDSDRRWVNQLWEHYIGIISTNRKTASQQFFPGAKKILSGIKDAHGDTAKFALNNKWVDSVISSSSIEEELTKIFGWNSIDNTINAVSFYNYHPSIDILHGDKIAVISVNGLIIDGLAKPGCAGGDTTASQIKDARLNPEVKSIILRVNSPGGSVRASELIRSELSAARASGKPIVVSMGSMAASGGYWISTPANTIIASSSTITGSIGIFGIINTFENTLANIGIHTDGVSSSSLADVSITKQLPPEVSQLIQMDIDNSYKNFISLTAQSRNKTPEEVNKIAKGQIWTGSESITNHLVDQLGDFDDAVIIAAKLAGLKQYQLHWYINDTSLINLLSSQMNYFLSKSAITQLLYSSIPPILTNKIASLLKTELDANFNWNTIRHSYAVCLSCIEL